LRLLIADDEAMVRSGLRLLIESEQDIEVVAEAADGAEAVEAARRTRPDVVLMDIRMPKLDGLAAARRLLEREAGPRVLMLTTFDEDENVFEALRIGASGFLLKTSPPEQLLYALRTVAEGNALIDPAVTRRLIESFEGRFGSADAPPELAELTERELEVLKFLARGLSNAEIAAELVVSPATVKTHVARILAKLGLRDRVQAVILAYEAGVVRVGDSA
jgi:DNA-binding NarL/FixJ family response regulator